MIPSLAGLAQLVECQLPKLDVAGSNPVSRSEKAKQKRPARTMTYPAFSLILTT
jgi:hypothetical protein